MCHGHGVAGAPPSPHHRQGARHLPQATGQRGSGWRRWLTGSLAARGEGPEGGSGPSAKEEAAESDPGGRGGSGHVTGDPGTSRTWRQGEEEPGMPAASPRGGTVHPEVLRRRLRLRLEVTSAPGGQNQKPPLHLRTALSGPEGTVCGIRHPRTEPGGARPSPHPQTHASTGTRGNAAASRTRSYERASCARHARGFRQTEPRIRDVN